MPSAPNAVIPHPVLVNQHLILLELEHTLSQSALIRCVILTLFCHVGNLPDSHSYTFPSSHSRTSRPISNQCFIFTQTQNQGVTGFQCSLVYDTNKDNYTPTIMYLDSHPTLSHQGCPVLISLDPCNHLLYHVVYHIFTVGGCHITIHKRHGLTTTSTANKYLYHQNRLPYLGPLFCFLAQKI